MFTSRAEFRLSLRADNADERLTGRGIALGCVGPERTRLYHRTLDELAAARAVLKAATASPTTLEAFGISVNQDGARRSAFELAAQPHFPLSRLARVWPELAEIPSAMVARLEADAKYAVYVERQADEIARHRRDGALLLPEGMDYAELPGLSREMRQKFSMVRPRSLGQAGRIEGVTPAALAVVAAHARRGARAAARSEGAM